jgi:predicted RNA-binding Zn-ribbon protein involved in translation (DUF1610 family)
MDIIAPGMTASTHSLGTAADLPGQPLEADIQATYISQMAEIFKCPHCGAVYEISYEGKTDSKHEATPHCQVCGKHISPASGSVPARYELVRMPDGTNV